MKREYLEMRMNLLCQSADKLNYNVSFFKHASR